MDIKTNNKSIFVLTGGLNYAGGTRVLLNLLKNINSNKYKIHLVLINKTNFDIRNEISEDINIIYLNQKIGKLNFIEKMRTVFGFLKLYFAKKPRIILSENMNSHILMYILSIIKFFIPKKFGSYWIARKGTLELGKSFFEKKLYKLVYKMPNHIVTPSQMVKDIVNKKMNITENKITKIYNPVDINNIKKKSFKKQRTGIKHLDDYIDSNGDFILYVGRLMKRKNVDLLVETAKIAYENRIDIKWVIIGSGDEYNFLKNKIKKYNLESYIYLTGYIENPYYFMQKASLFILPSEEEGFGYVLIEAMLCNCPVIALDTDGGPKEMIEHKYNGILVKFPYTAKKLFESTKSLLNDKESYNFIKKNGYTYAQKFDIEKITQKYEKVFELFLED
ncbi:glycosyltransferase, GT1 family [Halanaerobium saccharolyticum subsp. saccharolyticum DSM 6643]|uniref:Glycosyltransferase, GT1 family n=1 Tax=Halanaerobium saccharolyticum subsp. saccharolyticum DSM 6643 TaxID=1293054 RepID=M5E404_9FIRM|nr:glycosyltransferase [Halanaerobium saccharolyticum]CCU80946.1 glycosyltransferase, GT1 family [Halanaerobium saccharolyticum subsp. saccharolyticum DSM 6643]